MKALRSRTAFVALMVVAGSMITGVGLGLILTKVVRAADKPGAKASKRSVANRSRGVSRTGALASGRANSAGSGLGAAQPMLRQIPFDPRTLPTNLRQVSAPAGIGNSPHTHAVGTPTLPVFSYNVTAAQDGNNYSGLIVGRDPRNHAKVTTTLPTQIVPLIIKIDNGGGDVHTYDPTIGDGCNGTSAVDITTQSPLFNNNAWTMNGVNVGNTQYIDAHQRAQFWSLVGGTNYHLILNPSVLPAQTLTFGTNGTSGVGRNFNGGRCDPLGIVWINQLDQAVLNLMTGPLAGQINPGTFPLFATANVVSNLTPNLFDGNCCVLGYHSAIFNPTLQIYSPYNMDTAGYFGSGFTSALSHELGEAIDDPTTNNLTPPWGNLGQVVGGCQNNFENGDMLSPGFGTPTNPFNVTQNGRTYTMQELCFFNWVYGTTNPVLGISAGGKFSNHGTFGGDAILCPPGGTN